MFRNFERPFLVLGAGINGAAIARELILNHVPVTVVDTADICGGTTAYSSRLIHGGLRYLEYGEWDLVRESLEERNLLLRNAPHLVQPLQLFIPANSRTGGLMGSVLRFITGRSSTTEARGLWLVRAALWMYDRYARSSSLPKHSISKVGTNGPLVDASQFRWLCSYWDGQIPFVELLAVELLEDARRYANEKGIAFRVLPYHQPTRQGAQIHFGSTLPASWNTPLPQETQETELTPRAIINATGAWIDRTLRALNVESPQLIGGTKGSHLIVNHRVLCEALADSGIYTEAKDGRPVFLLPLFGTTLIGTTDVPYSGDPRNVTVSAEEIDYLLEVVNGIFPQLKVTHKHVEAHYCGVRPLPKSTTSSPGAITRRHTLHCHPNTEIPMFSVVGGKITTCRSLAEESIETILSSLDIPIRHNSRNRLLPGSDPYPKTATALMKEKEAISQATDFDLATIDAVWRLCGRQAQTRLSEDTSTELLPHTHLPCSYVRWVIRNQWVTRLSDMVERRLMLVFQPNLTSDCLRRLASLLVEEGVLPADGLHAEIEHCTTRLKNHFGKEVKDTAAAK